MTFVVVIPFRSRGNDWRREANLKRALEWWDEVGITAYVVDDGLTGDQQFNRSAAFNRAVQQFDADVICFSEADLLTPISQIEQGIDMARETPGLVVGFSRFMAMTERDSEFVRAHFLHPSEASAQQMRGDRESIGAVNIVSRESIEAIGQFDASFSGHGYDDDATELAFRICCGPTRFCEGPGYHQWHIPGALYATPESTEADRAATERNRQRYELYKQAKTPEDIRKLTGER